MLLLPECSLPGDVGCSHPMSTNSSDENDAVQESLQQATSAGLFVPPTSVADRDLQATENPSAGTGADSPAVPGAQSDPPVVPGTRSEADPTGPALSPSDEVGAYPVSPHGGDDC